MKRDEIWAKSKLANSIAIQLEKELTTKRYADNIKKCLQESYRAANALTAWLQKLHNILKNQ